MSTWLELFVLAVASIFWPTLIAIVVLALRLERPVKVLSWFLAGGHGRVAGGVAFAAGVVLNLVPGTFPIVALKDIAEMDAGNATKVVAIILFYVIMFAFVEVPIVAYLIAPERTTAAMNNFNAWHTENGRRRAVYVIAGVGLYLIVRGVVQLL